MKTKQLVGIAVLGTVILIFELFLAIYPNSGVSSSTSIQTVVTQAGSRPIENLSQYGSLTNLSAVPVSTETVNLNSPALSSMSLSLLQVRENGAIQVYNSTDATSFIPFWTQNFTLLVQAGGGTQNFTYPFNHTPEMLEQFCNYNSANGPTGCTMLTTITQSRPNIQITNFTLPDGGKGYAYRDFATFWDHGVEYFITSAGMSPAEVIQIADAMGPRSLVVVSSTTSS